MPYLVLSKGLPFCDVSIFLLPPEKDFLSSFPVFVVEVRKADRRPRPER